MGFWYSGCAVISKITKASSILAKPTFYSLGMLLIIYIAMRTLVFAQYLINKYAILHDMTLEDAANFLDTSLPLSMDALKKAYRKKVLESHPDRNSDKDTTEDLKQINLAAEILYHYIANNPININESEIEGNKDEFDVLLNSRNQGGRKVHRRLFNFGDFYLSIQGGTMQYCRPRTYLPNLSDYSELEIAFLFKDQRLFNPLHDKRFKNLPDINEYFSEYDEVAGYVPKGVIKRMFNYLRNKFDLVTELG